MPSSSGGRSPVVPIGSPPVIFVSVGRRSHRTAPDWEAWQCPAPFSSPTTSHPILDLVGEILTAAGYDVRLAIDGLDALDQALTTHPDLILTDFKMPNLDGLSLAERLRERDRSMPILLMSAAPPSITSPGIGVIRKPFNIPQLVTAVAEALDTQA